MVDFGTLNTSAADTRKILKVVARARKLGVCSDPLSLTMDLEAVHNLGCALDLDKLLGFDDGNFAHDVMGVSAHIDRDNGTLTDCFVPRCAKA